MPNRGNEHWQLPLQPEPAATKKDYYILLAVLVAVAAVVGVCCGIGTFLGTVLFG